MIVNNKIVIYMRSISDLLFLNLAYILACAIAASVEILYTNKVVLSLPFVLSISWIIFSKNLGLYDDFRSRDFSFELVNIIKNVIIQLVVSMVFLFTFSETMVGKSLLITYIALLLIFIGIKSYLLRRMIGLIRERGKNIRNVLIIGTGEVGYNFCKTIKRSSYFGYKLIGFLDDEKSPLVNGEYLGQIDNLEYILGKKYVDDVVVALPGYEINKIDSIIKVCNKEAVRVRIIPDYFRFLSPKYRISMFGEFPIITVRNEPLEELQWRIVKRCFDICFSLFVLLLIFPWIYTIVAVIQSITSPGPILFVQDRIGRKNKIFKCYKFRSMHVKSSLIKEYKATEQNDPRVTMLGKVLRKTNLDELPQFLNVFKGDMSVVGPRPHAISFNNKYSEVVEEIKMRHNVKPGITGWAQIHGLRGDVANEEENNKRTRKRIDFDLWYIENWTFWLDVQIISLTVWRMIKGDPNAY